MGRNINPLVKVAQNKTGITALSRRESFFKISYPPRKKEESTPRRTHILICQFIFKTTSV
jgi:hypothetical protein